MVDGLERIQEIGDLHFVTFSCYHREGYLAAGRCRDLFEEGLESSQVRYGLHVFGYVVMPEHVHLLVDEPPNVLLGMALQGLKLFVSRKATERPFWQARYYDFNVYRHAKAREKLFYIHANPVKRGLVEKPEDWTWSSYRYYQTGVQGRVTITKSLENKVSSI